MNTPISPRKTNLPFIQPESIIQSYHQDPLPNTNSPTQSFEKIPHPFETLEEKIKPCLPENRLAQQAFLKILKGTFSLSYESDLYEGQHSIAFLVRQGEAETPSMLQIIRTFKMSDSEGKNLFFCLTPKYVGIDWHLFLPNMSPLAEPTHAIAWNTQKNQFEILSKQSVVDHINGKEILTNQYLLYATLSPYIEKKTLLYTHPLISYGTLQKLENNFPKNSVYQCAFVLGAHLRNLEVLKYLGQGSFSKVWAVTFTDPEGTKRQTTLRLPKEGGIKSTEQKEKYHQISRERFGGEFGAFLPTGKYNNHTYFGIVWDEEKKGVRILKQSDIQTLYLDYTEKSNPKSIGNNILTLYGSLGEYHENSKTLKKYIEENHNTPFDVATIKKFAFQLLSGLQELKEKKVIHRDIKPDNILLLESGDLKIFDFGLSATGVDDEGAVSVVGSPLWMAPELLAKAFDKKPDSETNKTYDYSVDYYATYLILYELATGVHPFADCKNLPALQLAINALVTNNTDPKDDPKIQALDPVLATFFSHLGHPNPKKRLPLEKILVDKFLKEYADTQPQIRQSFVPFNLDPPPTKPTPPSDDPEKAPPLRGRVMKYAFIAGVVLFVCFIARYYLIQLTRPKFPREKLP